MSAQQQLIFNSPKLLHGEYPFRYNLLRVGSGEMNNMFWHINSIWDGYNSEGYPKIEIESRISKYQFADTDKDIRRIINEAMKEKNPHKTYYIMARFDDYNIMPEYQN